MVGNRAKPSAPNPPVLQRPATSQTPVRPAVAPAARPIVPGVPRPVAASPRVAGPTDAQVAAFVGSSLAQGKDPHELAADLVRRGVAAPRAEAAVIHGLKGVIAAKLRRRGLIEALIGAGLLAAGLAITAYTYVRANVGETYVVTTGLLLVGALGIARGTWTATHKARRVLKD